MASANFILVFASLAALLCASPCAARAPQVAYQAATMNQEINSTQSYLQMVNESSYLLFSPNMTNAYIYLDRAINISTSNPQAAQLLLTQARASAKAQYDSINSWRYTTIEILAVLTLAALALLVYVMKPRARVPAQVGARTMSRSHRARLKS